MSDLTNPRFPEKLLDPSTPTEDRRNVADHYKYWSDEDIKSDLDTKRHPFAVVAENFAYDFNLATLVRNCNAFLAQEIFIVGRKKWDRRGAVGTYKYQHIHNLPSWNDLTSRLESYTPVVFDNIDGAESIVDFEWPDNPVMVFGQESIGVSPLALEAAENVVYIPQFGSTRSINVGVASGIAMYDYISKL